jgi:hypothetical protein
METKLDRFIKYLPNQLSPASNPILNALIRAWAGQDDEILEQLKNTKAQLFVKTAEGIYLDRLASNYGVSRPFALGLLDEDFQQLIPNLSLKQKQITKSFYDTMDVFWGPIFSRANVEATLNEPYDIYVGDRFELRVDGGQIQKINVLPGDVRIQGAVTADEAIRIFSRFENITVQKVDDPTSSAIRLNFRTNTPGTRGSIEFISGFDGIGVEENVKHRVTDLKQRSVLYQINAGEVLIELPAIVPTLRRTLRGSHHFHADAALESPVPPANGIWAGSFAYSTTKNPFVVTSTKAVLQQTIIEGSVLIEITVDDASAFPADGGKLIFNFGKSNQEQPINFITVPNDNTILIDPGYTFQNTHLSGSTVNLLLPNQITPYAPREDGADLAIYLTSPSNARSVVQEILKSLAAAGITVSFLILLPEYTYLIENPFSI